MNPKFSARRVAGRRRAPDSLPEHGSRSERFFNRTTAIVSLAVAVVALAVALFSFLQDRVGKQILTRPDLKVVQFEATVKGQLSAESTNPVTDEVSKLDGGRSGPAVTVSVLNSGEEPGLLTELEVTVNRVWMMDGCWGAGGWLITAQYDVPLPDDLFAYGREPQLPRVIRAEAGFEVAGKDVDTFTVAIGRPGSPEGSWPLLYAIDLTLVERSGQRIHAGSAVLMDQQDVVSVDNVVNDARNGGSLLNLDCVRKNAALLETVANTPGKQSPAIGEWRTKLPAVFEPRGSGSVTTPTQPPGHDAVDTWIVQLQSLRRDATSGEALEQARQAMQQRLGLPVSVLDSSDFASLNPGYWVLYHAAGFQDGHQAVAVCTSRGLEDCVGRYLSRDSRDRHLICRAPTSGVPSTCRRS
jgi:hypothetical protein